ncbi:MAG: hypothetical protein ACJ71J_05060 [Nitrososphaeraceae archaeon]
MFTKRTTAALFAIAIASSLIVASGFVGSAFAAKKGQKPNDDTYKTLSAGQDKSDSPKLQSANTGDSSGSIGDTSGLSAKELKKLSKCQSDAAADGDLTLGEVKDCYGQVSDRGQGQEQGKEDQSSSARGNDQSEDGQGQLALGQG